MYSIEIDGKEVASCEYLDDALFRALIQGGDAQRPAFIWLDEGRERTFIGKIVAARRGELS